MNGDWWGRIRGLGSEIWKMLMVRAFGSPDMPQQKQENIPNFLRKISNKLSIEHGNICNKVTMEKRLERLVRLRLMIRPRALNSTL